MKNIYLVPALSIAFLAIFFLGGNITGLVTFDPAVQANILLTTTEDDVLPGDAIIQVDFAGQSKSFAAEDFIMETGMPYERRAGKFGRIGYAGEGFTGEYVYSLSLDDLGFSTQVPEGEHTLKITVHYKDTFISSYEEVIRVA